MLMFTIIIRKEVDFFPSTPCLRKQGSKQNIFKEKTCTEAIHFTPSKVVLKFKIILKEV